LTHGDIQQGDHQVGHWPTFLVISSSFISVVLSSITVMSPDLQPTDIIPVFIYSSNKCLIEETAAVFIFAWDCVSNSLVMLMHNMQLFQ